MPITFGKSNGYEVIYDNETKKIISIRKNELLNIRDNKKEVLFDLRKRNLKKQGIDCVKKELINDWLEFIDSFLENSEEFYYNGMTVYESLKYMQALSNGKSVQEVCDVINLIEEDLEVYNENMALIPANRDSVISLISFYHERGIELEDEYKTRKFKEQKLNKLYLK